MQHGQHHAAQHRRAQQAQQPKALTRCAGGGQSPQSFCRAARRRHAAPSTAPAICSAAAPPAGVACEWTCGWLGALVGSGGMTAAGSQQGVATAGTLRAVRTPHFNCCLAKRLRRCHLQQRTHLARLGLQLCNCLSPTFQPKKISPSSALALPYLVCSSATAIWKPSGAASNTCRQNSG